MEETHIDKDMEEDEELVALRLAALATLKSRKKDNITDSSACDSLPISSIVSTSNVTESENNKIPFLQSDRNLYNPHSWRKQPQANRRRGNFSKASQRSNLIIISPVSTEDSKEGEKPVAALILPQHKWCNSGNEESMSPKTLRRTGPTRFNRHGSDSESSDSDYENSDNDSGSNETVLQDELPKHFNHPSELTNDVPDATEKQRRLSFQNLEPDIKPDVLDKPEATSVYNCLKNSNPSFDYNDSRCDSYTPVQNLNDEQCTWEQSIENDYGNYKQYHSSHSYSSEPSESTRDFSRKQNISLMSNGEAHSDEVNNFAIQHKDSSLWQHVEKCELNNYYSNESPSVSDNSKTVVSDRKSKDYFSINKSDNSGWKSNEEHEGGSSFSSRGAFDTVHSRISGKSNYSGTKNRQLSHNDLRLELKKRMEQCTSKTDMEKNENNNNQRCNENGNWVRNRERNFNKNHKITEFNSNAYINNYENSSYHQGRREHYFNKIKNIYQNNSEFQRKKHEYNLSQDRSKQECNSSYERTRHEHKYSEEQTRHPRSSSRDRRSSRSSSHDRNRHEHSSSQEKSRYERNSGRSKYKQNSNSHKSRRERSSSSHRSRRERSSSSHRSRHERSSSSCGSRRERSSSSRRSRRERSSSSRRSRHERSSSSRRSRCERSSSSCRSRHERSSSSRGSRCERSSNSHQNKHELSFTSYKKRHKHSFTSHKRKRSHSSSQDGKSERSSSQSDTHDHSSHKDIKICKNSFGEEKNRHARSLSRERSKQKRSSSSDKNNNCSSQNQNKYEPNSSQINNVDCNSNADKNGTECGTNLEIFKNQGKSSKDDSSSTRNVEDCSSLQDKTKDTDNSKQKNKSRHVKNPADSTKSENSQEIRNLQVQRKKNDEKSKLYSVSKDKFRKESNASPSNKSRRQYNSNYEKHSRSGSRSSLSSTSSSSVSSHQSSKRKIHSVPSVVKSVQSKVISVEKRGTYFDSKCEGRSTQLHSTKLDASSPPKKCLDVDRIQLNVKYSQMDNDMKTNVSDSNRRVPVHMRLGAFPRKRVIQMTKDVEAAFVNTSSGSDAESVNTKCKRQNIRIVTDVNSSKEETSGEKKLPEKEKYEKRSDIFKEKVKRAKTLR